MARLIPRKQIEEQQNISGSFRVGEDINIGNNAIISGSIFVSQSFFLGNDTGSKSEITGSVFLTGSLEIDGQLIFRGPEAILSATSSNISESFIIGNFVSSRTKEISSRNPWKLLVIRWITSLMFEQRIQSKGSDSFFLPNFWSWYATEQVGPKEM